jgi:hypothetical protein
MRGLTIACAGALMLLFAGCGGTDAQNAPVEQIEQAAGKGRPSDAGPPSDIGPSPDAAADPDAQVCAGSCALPNAVGCRSGGVCVIASCVAGFADCDGMASNGCETAIDTTSNCGACGVACVAPNGVAACVAGACAVASCDSNRADCDGVVGNGCEVDLQKDVSHCGACSTACSAPANATAACAAGSCTSSCNAGFGSCGGSCIDIVGDVANCGGCGVRCTTPGATPTCTAGVCSIGACDVGRADCDGNTATGCEIDLNGDPKNCGTCATACPTPANAVPTCSAGACGFACLAGFMLCDGKCVDSTSDWFNCGGCGNTCALTGAVSKCSDSACAISECKVGFADCDGLAKTGCESELARDPAHCGSCATKCSAPANGIATCDSGTCGFTCQPGFTRCGGECVNVAINPSHCGACGNACSSYSGSMTCSAGSCQVTTCNPGYADCDGFGFNACETKTEFNVMNCGGCGIRCLPPPNASPTCEFGKCGFACLPGFILCDGRCVDPKSDAANCGGCGNACSFPNAGATCTAGACAITACTASWANCDGAVVNGCETNTMTSAASCGGCADSKPARLVGLEMTPNVANLVGVGSTTSLRVLAYYSDKPGAPTDVTASATFTSTNPGAVTISGGVATSVAAGYATISASLGGVYASAPVRVWDAARYASLTRLYHATWRDHVNHGDCFQTKVMAEFGAGDVEDVTTTALFSAGFSGRVLTGGLYAAVGPRMEGYQNVTVSLVPGGTSVTRTIGVWGPAFNGSCGDPRVPGELRGILVSAPSTEYIGEAAPLKAIGYYSDGSQRSMADKVAWESGTPTTLTVSDDGWASGKSAGSGRVFATYPPVCGAVAAGASTITGKASVNVVAAPALGTMTSLRLEPPNANTTSAFPFHMKAFATYSGVAGRTFNVTDAATWTSANPSVASVLAGSGTGGTIGTTSISASLSGFVAAGNVRTWAFARLNGLTSITIGAASNMSLNTCQQLSLIGEFDKNPLDHEDLAQTAIWRVDGTFTHPELGTTGMFCPKSRTSYWVINASLGRSILAPTATEIGVW